MKLERMNARQAVRFKPNSRDGQMAVVRGVEGVSDLWLDEAHGCVVVKCEARRGTTVKTTLVPLSNVADMEPEAELQEPPRRTRRVSSKPTDD